MFLNRCNSAAPSAPPAGRDAFLACVRFLSGLKKLTEFVNFYLLMEKQASTHLNNSDKVSKIIYGA